MIVCGGDVIDTDVKDMAEYCEVLCVDCLYGRDRPVRLRDDAFVTVSCAGYWRELRARRGDERKHRLGISYFVSIYHPRLILQHHISAFPSSRHVISPRCQVLRETPRS